ncbi:uncharacterized protein SCHCODRAFT_02153236 [Schizophyllum commune H4-8]|uniref:uncharacterized protein n=1 Tax=Schizophyllum commune (strain H4-8 / FGSC 9210) TaxID=578458 RepID=UPI00215EADFC|nr:uncharacterized protein SCHCODRAFT_02153236 [Schizophyllum commune H4-8]KAI5897964.1 hypothetical protein SCHCODRAFT_02153236 [Schizophyllum commune H4-8]
MSRVVTVIQYLRANLYRYLGVTLTPWWPTAPPDDRSKSNQCPRARGNGVRMKAVSCRLRSYYTSHSDLMWRSGAGKPNNPTFELALAASFSCL